MKGRLPRPRAIDGPRKNPSPGSPVTGPCRETCQTGESRSRLAFLPVPGSVMTATTSRTPLSRKSPNNRSPHGKHTTAALRPGRRAGRIPSGSRPGRRGPQSPLRPHVPGRAHRLRHVRLAPSREDDWLHLVSAPAACSCRPRPLTARRWPADCSAPGAGGIREFDSTVFRAAYPPWPCRWPVPLALGLPRIRRPARFGACARDGNRHAWRLATACGFVITGRLPPPAGWPGAASTWTASSCSARRRRWRAP